MIDLERDLRDAADAYAVPAGDLDVVRARGERRRARRTGAARGGALLAAAALVAGVTALGTGGDDDRTPVASEGATAAGAPTFAWTAAFPEGSDAISLFGYAAESAGGRLYALSTAPGQREVDGPTAKVAWTSDDGERWTPVGSPDDLYLTDLAGRGDRIYAVGTGPASGVVDRSGAEVPSALVGWSDDGAGSFTTADLPLDLAPIAAVSSGVVHSNQVTTVGDTVVVALGVRAELDVRALLPDGASAPHGWALGPDGVTVLGAPKPGCDVGAEEPPRRVWGAVCDGEKSTSAAESHEPGTSYTWRELGVEGDVLTAVLGHPFLFAGTAEDGFDRVEVPGLPPTVGSFALDGGDLLVTSGDGGSTVAFRSDDGRTWTSTDDLPAGVQWASTVGRIGDRTIVVGEHLVVGAGGGWTTFDVAGLLGDALAEGEQVVLTTADVGPAGAVIAGLTFDEGREGPGRWFVVTSANGTTWAAEWLDDLAGAAIGTVGRVMAGEDRVVVQAGVAGERTADGHVRQVALVGRPAAG